MSLKCEVCTSVPHKYKCPRCLKKTCSLACVKIHKKRDDCNGTRDKTGFIKVKEFTNSNLQSDYNFLEDVCRTSDIASRDRAQKSKHRPAFVHKFFNQAKRRGILLRLLPFPMTKRKQNSSHYDFKTHKITWLTEWKFPYAEAAYKHRFNEETLLSDSLNHFIDPTTSDPVIRHNLQRYVSQAKEDIKILMKAEGRPANEIMYYDMDPKSTITENLKGKVIVEYPTFIVVLKDKWNDYPVITEECRTKNPDEINIDKISDDVDESIINPKPVYHSSLEASKRSEYSGIKDDKAGTSEGNATNNKKGYLQNEDSAIVNKVQKDSICNLKEKNDSSTEQFNLKHT